MDIEMIASNFEKVREFHHAFGLPVHETARIGSAQERKLRFELIEEELGELFDAMNDKDVVEIADALTDLLYVTYGAALVFGIDIDACFDEVHRSNMSKLGEDGQPIYREDGKVLKGPNYNPPELARMIKK